MNFVCDQQALYDMVTYISRYSTKFGISGKEQLLFLSVKDEILTLKGASFAIYSVVNTPVQMKETGEAVVDGQLLLNMISTMAPGDIIVSGEKRLTLKQGQTVHRLSTGSVGDFPLIPEVTSNTDMVVDANMLVEAFSRVGFAKQDDKGFTMPVLGGYFIDLDVGTVLATDKYRIAYYTLEKGGGQIIFPADGAETLSRALKLCPANSIRIQPTANEGWTLLTLTNGVIDVSVYVASIAGKYPLAFDFVDEIRNRPNATSISVSKKDILPPLRLAKALSNLGGVFLRVTAGTGQYITLEMSTSDGEMCDRVGGNVFGDPVTFVISPTHFIQIVNAAPEDQIDIKTWNPPQVVLITSGKSWGALQALMEDRGAAKQQGEQQQAGEDTEDF